MASLTDHDGYRGQSDVSVIKRVWKVGPLEGAQELCKSGCNEAPTNRKSAQTGAHRYNQQHPWPSISSSSSLIFCVYCTPRKPALAWYPADGSSADTLLDFGKRLRSLLVFKHRTVTRFWRFYGPEDRRLLAAKTAGQCHDLR